MTKLGLKFYENKQQALLFNCVLILDKIQMHMCAQTIIHFFFHYTGKC